VIEYSRKKEKKKKTEKMSLQVLKGNRGCYAVQASEGKKELVRKNKRKQKWKVGITGNILLHVSNKE